MKTIQFFGLLTVCGGFIISCGSEPTDEVLIETTMTDIGLDTAAFLTNLKALESRIDNSLDMPKEKDLKEAITAFQDFAAIFPEDPKAPDYLLKKFEINTKPKDYYLNKKEIKYLKSLGMLIGSHSESHTLLSRLSYREQFKELNNSKIFLEKIINQSIDTFCYPYGGKISYNGNTLKILKKLKYKLADSVEYRDISFKDTQQKPYELPRYDCNLF